MYKEVKMKKYTKPQAELQEFKICDVIDGKFTDVEEDLDSEEKK